MPQLKQLKNIIARQELTGEPGFWTDQPHVPGWARWAYRAYEELDSDRDVGLGRGPIKWTAINAYALRRGLSFERQQFLCRMVRAVDAGYDLWSKEQKAVDDAAKRRTEETLVTAPPTP